MSIMLKAGKEWLIGSVALVWSALLPMDTATMATVNRPIGQQLPPRQVKGIRHRLQLEHHLEIIKIHAHSMAQSLKCPLLVAPKDTD